MNLIEAWNATPYGDEIVLFSKFGDELVRVVKRGSFAGVIRQLYDMTSEENILSSRWRWRIK